VGRTIIWFGTENSNFIKFTALMLIRPTAILLSQVGIFMMVGSWNDTFAWWPFQMIASNCICFLVLIKLTKNDRVPLRKIYLSPFEKGIGIGGITGPFRERHFKNRALNVLYDISLFMTLLLTLGLIAFCIVRQIDHQIQARVMLAPLGALPLWAVISITILLPLTMPFVEVPWYFGYFFPKLEELLGGKGRHTGLLVAFSLTTTAFALQHCFQPFFFNGTFIALRFFKELPLILLAAWVIRTIPRFTPYILFLHGCMAVEVVVKSWQQL
jgi:hypothetical protein